MQTFSTYRWIITWVKLLRRGSKLYSCKVAMRSTRIARKQSQDKSRCRQTRHHSSRVPLITITRALTSCRSCKITAPAYTRYSNRWCLKLWSRTILRKHLPWSRQTRPKNSNSRRRVRCRTPKKDCSKVSRSNSWKRNRRCRKSCKQTSSNRSFPRYQRPKNWPKKLRIPNLIQCPSLSRWVVFPC